MTTSRDVLLELVANFVSSYFGECTALEHDVGDYSWAGLLRSNTGTPIAHWTFHGATRSCVPYADQRAPLYFHIDEENNRAVLVSPRGTLSGGGFIIDGVGRQVQTIWRS